MKALVSLLLSVSFAIAQTDSEPARSTLDDFTSSIVRLACKDPFRKVGTDLYDLTPRFFDATEMAQSGQRQTFTTRPLPEWYFHWGKVVSVLPKGVLLRSYDEIEDLISENTKYKVVFIKNYPRQTIDDQIFACYALPDGVYAYASAGNSLKTVEAYDYGKTPNKAELEKLKAEAQVRSKNFQTAIEDQKSKAAAAEKNRKAELNANVLKLIRLKAHEGVGSYQLRLGDSYWKGNGVPRDLEQAKFWTACACTNGESGATNLLRNIRAYEATNSIAAQK